MDLRTGIAELEKECASLQNENKILKETIEISGKRPYHCKACKHFVQHYVKNYPYGIGYFPLDCGHCTKRGVVGKRKKHATDTVCDFFDVGTFGIK